MVEGKEELRAILEQEVGQKALMVKWDAIMLMLKGERGWATCTWMHTEQGGLLFQCKLHLEQ